MTILNVMHHPPVVDGHLTIWVVDLTNYASWQLSVLYTPILSLSCPHKPRLFLLIFFHITWLSSHSHVQNVHNMLTCYMPVRELGSTSFSVIPVTSLSFPSFPSSLRHHHLFILRTVHYRLSLSLRLSSFVLFFVTDLFRPCHVPSIISRFCGCTILL